MTRLPPLRVPAALLLLAACSSDAPIKDQANGPIDKGPASWGEPGAEADPPVQRDAGETQDAGSDAETCAPAALTSGADSCTFTVAEADLERGFTLLLDGDVLEDDANDGYQLSGTTLTLVGAACAKLSAADGDAGADAGDGGARDAAASHSVELRPNRCAE